jgi:hypothetical protein
MLMGNGNGVLSPQSVTEMESPSIGTQAYLPQQYSLGLLTQPFPFGPHALVWHNGELPGYSSELILVPDFGFAVVVMLNVQAPGLADWMAIQGVKAFNSEAEQWPSPAVPPTQWGAYVGTYSDPYGELGELSVTLNTGDGGTPQLWVAAVPDAGLSGPMAQQFDDEWAFPAPYSAFSVTFWRDDAGIVTKMVSRAGIAGRQN